MMLRSELSLRLVFVFVNRRRSRIRDKVRADVTSAASLQQLQLFLSRVAPNSSQWTTQGSTLVQPRQALVFGWYRLAKGRLPYGCPSCQPCLSLCAIEIRTCLQFGRRSPWFRVVRVSGCTILPSQRLSLSLIGSESLTYAL